MIKYKDFSPEITRANILGAVKESDSFELVVKQVNIWVGSNPIKVINIETILFPNLHLQPKMADLENGVMTVGQGHNIFQCVRVWYEEK